MSRKANDLACRQATIVTVNAKAGLTWLRRRVDRGPREKTTCEAIPEIQNDCVRDYITPLPSSATM